MVPDLMFGSKISGAAKSLGVEANGFRSLERLTKIVSEQGSDIITLLVVDLDCGDDGLAILQASTELLPDARRIAYGPHVEADLLERARGCGATDVMSRGEFAANIMTILGA